MVGTETRTQGSPDTRVVPAQAWLCPQKTRPTFLQLGLGY